ncbi:MAG TPA: hypothetical protein PLD27_11500 [bacterium]|nr:hypothetical protein [bacterium]HOL48313.1 hypothetical protein [bacterium]HPQ19786.1 hypothetical protein [bacterium]
MEIKENIFITLTHYPNNENNEIKLNKSFAYLLNIMPDLLVAFISKIIAKQTDESSIRYLINNSKYKIYAPKRINYNGTKLYIDLVLIVENLFLLYIENKINSRNKKFKNKLNEINSQLENYFEYFSIISTTFMYKYFLLITKNDIQIPDKLMNNKFFLKLRWFDIYNFIYEYYYQNLEKESDNNIKKYLIKNFLEYLETYQIHTKNNKKEKEDKIMIYREIVKSKFLKNNIEMSTKELPDAVIEKDEEIKIYINPEMKIDRNAIRFYNKGKAMPISKEVYLKIFLDLIKYIVEYQWEYISFQKYYPEPISFSMLARKFNINISIILRILKERRILTDFGFFYITDLFTKCFRTNTKQIISQREIENQIIEITKYENNNLTDKEICKKLNEKGIIISRRTIAKYRKKLNILSSYERKESITEIKENIKILFVTEKIENYKEIIDNISKNGYAVKVVNNYNNRIKKNFDIIFWDVMNNQQIELIKRFIQISEKNFFILLIDNDIFTKIENAQLDKLINIDYIEKPVTYEKINKLLEEKKLFFEMQNYKNKIFINTRILLIEKDTNKCQILIKDYFKNFEIKKITNINRLRYEIREKSYDLIIINIDITRSDLIFIQETIEKYPNILFIIYLKNELYNELLPKINNENNFYNCQFLETSLFNSLLKLLLEKHYLKILNNELLNKISEKNKEIKKLNNKNNFIT